MNDRCTEFRSWFESNGGWIHPNINWPTNDGNSRGIIWNSNPATPTSYDTTKEFFELVKVPWNLVISRDNCLLRDDWLLSFSLANPDITSDLIIGIFLLTEMRKGEDSFYFPYFCILPKIWLPYEESDLALSEYRDVAFLAQCQFKRKMMNKLYSDISAKIAKFDANKQLPLFSDFCSAWKIICTRGFHGVVLSSAASGTLLCPFADLFNHKNYSEGEAKISTYDLSPTTENRTFVLYCSTSFLSSQVNQSEELLISYGATRNNFDLLTAYGFCCFSTTSPQLACPFEVIKLSLPLVPLLSKICLPELLTDDRILDVCELLTTVCGLLVSDLVVIQIEEFELDWDGTCLDAIRCVVRDLYEYFHFDALDDVKLKEIVSWWILDHNLDSLVVADGNLNERSLNEMLIILDQSIKDDAEMCYNDTDAVWAVRYRLMRKMLLRRVCS